MSEVGFKPIKPEFWMSQKMTFSLRLLAIPYAAITAAPVRNYIQEAAVSHRQMLFSGLLSQIITELALFRNQQGNILVLYVIKAFKGNMTEFQFIYHLKEQS